MNPAMQKAASMNIDVYTKKRLIRTLLGLFIFCLSLTVLFLGMRAVMEVGGACAEGGGAYQIRVHCPKGTAFLIPLSIFAMLGGTFLNLGSLYKGSPAWGVFFWSALFMSLGWNFLEFGLFPDDGNYWATAGWIVCGVMFELMGALPLLGFSRSELRDTLLGEKPDTVQIHQSQGHLSPLPSRALVVVLHIIATSAGIYAGWWIVDFFSK